jgi:hypothetical protein
MICRRSSAGLSSRALGNSRRLLAGWGSNHDRTKNRRRSSARGLRSRRTSLAKIALELNVPTPVLESFVQGRTFPPIEVLNKIAERAYGPGVELDLATNLFRSIDPPKDKVFATVRPPQFEGKAPAANERWPRTPSGKPLPPPPKNPKPGWSD